MRILWVSFAILAVDQLTKVWVVASMFPGQSIPVLGDWLKFTFTTNPGMAFGLEVGPKLFLSVFSIVATVAIAGYLWVVRSGPLGYRLALATIIGGAAGNVIDRTFYGVLMPGQNAPLFYGEVVDFIHIDLYRGFVDLPLLGPTFIPLFPIWNVADMAIVVGVAAIVLFQGRFHEQMVARQTGLGTRPEDPQATGAPLPAEPGTGTPAPEPGRPA